MNLVYERLKNYCTTCFCLTHDIVDCPLKLARTLQIKTSEDRQTTPKSHGRQTLVKEKEPYQKSYQERRDRYGRPFGERPSSKNPQLLEISSWSNMNFAYNDTRAIRHIKVGNGTTRQL